MAEKKCPECKEGAPEWMTTYGDMVTLLMAFFVMLFAFSNIDAQKFEQVMQSFQGSAGILSGGVTLNQNDLVFEALPESNITETVKQVEDNLEILKETIEEYIELREIESEVSVEFDSRGLIIRFKDNALFDSGSATLKSTSEDTLLFISELLKNEEFMDRAVRVEGHTDDIPISTLRFPSNWELSTARSTNVIKFFINGGGIEPNRLSASGYGEYYPIADNGSPEGRAKNRRVDIVILSRFFENGIPQDEGITEESTQ